MEPAESEESKELLLSEEASLSLMLLQLNGTEGVGCVKRIAEGICLALEGKFLQKEL